MFPDASPTEHFAPPLALSRCVGEVLAEAVEATAQPEVNGVLHSKALPSKSNGVAMGEHSGVALSQDGTNF